MLNNSICGMCDDCFELKDRITKKYYYICMKDNTRIDNRLDIPKNCPFILEHVIGVLSEKTITEEMSIRLESLKRKYSKEELEELYDENG